MTDIECLKSLLTRLREAKEGNREIDGEIALSKGWTFVKMKGDRYPYWRTPEMKEYYRRVDSGPPLYTFSLDAARSLLPAGWTYTLMGGVGASCLVSHEGADLSDEEGMTEPLALCTAIIAALVRAAE